MQTRPFFAVVTLASVAALVFALALEYVGGLEPCPLCIFQRIAMLGIAVVAVVGWIHNPQRTGRLVYTIGVLLAAGLGAAIAARHVWLTHLPPDQVPACGPGLDYLVQIMPLSEVVAIVLRGDASCATVEGSFMGIGLPAWSLMLFCLFVLFGLYGLVRRPAPVSSAQSSD